MRDLPRSINSQPGAGQPWRDGATARPSPRLTLRRRSSRTAAAAGTTQRPFWRPSLGVTTDASPVFGKPAQKSSGAVGEVEKGRNEIVSALFHANLFSSLLAGRDRPFGLLERGEAG